MQIQFLGAAGTVTGSKYLVSTREERVLVDCGLFQGLKQLRLRNWAPPPIDAASLSAVVLTHAHLDHSGYLPLLVKRGFHGPIHCTPATYELCKLLLPDCGHLQEEDADYANRHGCSKHHPALPLYTQQDAERCLRYFAPVPAGGTIGIGTRLRAELLPAGHILGACFARIDDGATRIVFSGDLGRPHDPIMAPPHAPLETDFLVVESTYGDRVHPRSEPCDELAAVVSRTIRRGGVIVVPSFAVGRAQALLYCIHRLKRERRIPQDLPVFLNSPMAVDVTELYLRFRAEHRLGAAECEAVCHAATYVNSVEQSEALNARTQPMIVIAASGMATGGRVVHHLKAFAPDPCNTVLFSGYQAAGTRGAAMLAGAPHIRIHGRDVPVRAEIAVLSSLSAHADGEEMLDWMSRLRTPPRRTFITHGEPVAADALRQRIERRLGWAVCVPEHREVVEL
ncbi:MAG TPA: MBL fold metallo-hydrolase [Rudaea sp.]|nr:MBL fold metallo-hydrolase [Rudaea sp.]